MSIPSMKRMPGFSTNSGRLGRLDRGFGAATAVILIAFGAMAMSLSALAAASLYADSVGRREWRLQKVMNARACQDAAALAKAKDFFSAGSVDMPEFGCPPSF